MPAKLTLEIPAGTKLDEACEEAQRLASALGRPVRFQFNSILCVAMPGGDAALLAERQSAKQEETPTVYSSLELA